TNKDLKEEVEAKRFRLDLYHRLGVILIQVPSLRNRVEDIPLLVDHFLTILAAEYNQSKKTIDKSALNLLCEYEWLGNIRELKNAIERLVILSDKNITTKDVEMYIFMK